MTLGLMMRWLKTEINCVNSWNNAKQGAGEIDKLMMQAFFREINMPFHVRIFSHARSFLVVAPLMTEVEETINRSASKQIT